MRRSHAALALAALLVAGTITALIFPRPPPPGAVHRDLTVRTVLRNGTDGFQLRVVDPLDATVRIEILNATHAGREPRVLEAKTNTDIDLGRRELGELVVIRARAASSEAPVLTKWIFTGRAHVLVADSMQELRHAMEASP